MSKARSKIHPSALAGEGRGQPNRWDIDLDGLDAEALRDLVRQLQELNETQALENEELSHAYDLLAKAREELAEFYDEAPIGFLTLSLQGVVTQANSAAAAMLGLPQAWLISKRFSKHLAPESASAYLAHRRTVLDTGRPGSCELRLTRADGGLVDVKMFLAVSPGGRTAPRHLRAAVVDITEHKQVEQRLRLTAAVIEAANEGIVITDARGRITAANPAFTALSGFRFAHLEGEDLGTILTEDCRKQMLEPLWRALVADGTWTGEVQCRRRNGSPFPASASFTVVHDESGACVHCAAVLTDITRQKHVQSRMFQQANYDAVTGLANRRLFMERLSQARRHAHRTRSGLALMFIDLDQFKPINDSFGHDAGDELLREVASRMTGCIRENDTVARVGGDEFAVILNGLASGRKASSVAEKIIDSASRPFTVAGHTLSIGVSIGIATYPADTEDLRILRRYADTAMYDAKAAGGSSYRFFSTM